MNTSRKKLGLVGVAQRRLHNSKQRKFNQFPLENGCIWQSSKQNLMHWWMGFDVFIIKFTTCLLSDDSEFWSFGSRPFDCHRRSRVTAFTVNGETSVANCAWQIVASVFPFPRSTTCFALQKTFLRPRFLAYFVIPFKIMVATVVLLIEFLKKLVRACDYYWTFLVL